MTPKERRDRLFKRGKPFIRPIEIFSEDGYGYDMKILWAAYKKNSFPSLEDMNQDEFGEVFSDLVNGYPFGWIIEDRNDNFASGSGPVGLMLAMYNGWELEPHWEPFSWATDRNKLSSVATFLQMIKYDKRIGIVNVYSLDRTSNLFDRLANDYGLLKKLGVIPKGDVRGNRHVYYTRGKKICQA